MDAIDVVREQVTRATRVVALTGAGMQRAVILQIAAARVNNGACPGTWRAVCC